MMNDSLSRMISARICLPQKEHHHLRMIACDIMYDHRECTRILSVPGLRAPDKQYRFRIQLAADHQIHHPQHGDPEIE